ncbi:NAD-glutamate dehydrogenase domain-containing protein [Neomicrococcus lactis]|uniref:Glutamate dehydrogenase n=1 Tax=Neomicrococcus lactis TaxID=732241 RepID=A0A7W8Y960_9MICC|nr:glutamate dehydrogenase [Neomicrococcus lactis]
MSEYGTSSVDSIVSKFHTPELETAYFLHVPEVADGEITPNLRENLDAHLALGHYRTPKTPQIGVMSKGNSTLVQVVTDDMPFLVDSVTGALTALKLGIERVIHPTFAVRRDKQTHELMGINTVRTTAPLSSGDTAALPVISGLVSNPAEAIGVESWISIEVEGTLSEEKQAEIRENLERSLGDVRASVEDWGAMRDRMRSITEEISWYPFASEIDDLEVSTDLLKWLVDDNFTFLGYREYELVTEDGVDALRPVAESGLGLLRRLPDQKVQHLTESGRKKARELKTLVITKANSRSTVHRSVYLDYIGVKSFDADGRVVGERRFIGLFASSAYISSVMNIPLVRDKVKRVLQSSGFARNSHSGKDLLTILETYPRDELFQMSEEELKATANRILALQERRRTSLILRKDVYGRFVSAVIFFPRDRYTTSVRLRVEEELQKAFGGESMDFEARLTESALVRLFYRIRMPRGAKIPPIDERELEVKISRAVRSWQDGVSQVIVENLPGEVAPHTAQLWRDAFPTAYKVDFEVEDALTDIVRFEKLESPDNTGPILSVYHTDANEKGGEPSVRLKLYLDKPSSLTDLLPIFQNLGIDVIDERPFEVSRADDTTFYIYDLGVRVPESIDLDSVTALLEEAYVAVSTGQAESDRLNRLILPHQIGWRDVTILRAYAKYFRQLGVTNTYGFIASAFDSNPTVTKALIQLFHALFDPNLAETERESAVTNAREELSTALQGVPTLDADRLLRRFANVIEATKRTNFYQGHASLSFKIAPHELEEAPFPRPKHEIWVYAPSVEGTHLRFGDVARGGLRWSDRAEDFRTEVLGLVKAQLVKNAVIVPTGAKGGFFAKQLPNPAVDRNAWMEAGKAAYRIFIRSLLDITDNLVTEDGKEVVAAPKNVVRRDGDDTYLVVAADKGTASFSDIANAISLEVGHWLGDAFASGGSVGYDHKAMGITARGAWESVKRHFFELGLDTQTEEFSVAGIGDMSGDVFGNGMLRSQTMKLVAAFDHRHIFLDPNPDPAASFAERERLFNLPRSSWDDYNKELISQGGGVFARDVKSVPISDEVRQVLGLDESVQRMSPPDLLSAILKAPVDLLYNGGVGTYIKSSSETHTNVGDRSNDAIRVDGREIRARVIGEGGNLGMTQLGRIEAALNGVILNTDAIDNSAGVDCSDHEVNIKILVDRMVNVGELSADERADFLMSMTDNVGDLVLENNKAQNVALLNDRFRLKSWSPSFERFLDFLEQHAELDRDLEFLPSNQELEARLLENKTLTSPELSVLLAYSKIQLTKEIAESQLSADPYFEDTLMEYFPAAIGERFGDKVQTHPLRNEIISTVVSNEIINTGGITFAFRAQEETGVSAAIVARSHLAIMDIFDLRGLVQALNELPAGFPLEGWWQMHLTVRRLLDRSTRWFINNLGSGTDIASDVAQFQSTASELRAILPELLQDQDLERVNAFAATAREWGAPEEVAVRFGQLFEEYPLLDIARLASSSGTPARLVAEVYFRFYSKFEADGMLDRITALPREDRWQALARAAMRDDLYSTVIDMTRSTLDREDTPESAEAAINEWLADHEEQLARAKQVFDEVNSLEHDDMASLSVALRVLRSISRK